MLKLLTLYVLFEDEIFVLCSTAQGICHSFNIISSFPRYELNRPEVTRRKHQTIAKYENLVNIFKNEIDAQAF